MQETCRFVSVFWDVALKFFRLLRVSVQVPGPAPNLQVVSVSTASVSLSWERPVTGNGEIQTYKLFYSEKGQDSEQVRTDESWKSSCSLETLLYHSHKLLNIWSPIFTCMHIQYTATWPNLMNGRLTQKCHDAIIACALFYLVLFCTIVIPWIIQTDMIIPCF